jgi:2-phosphosulfolactate phosphatase
MAAERELMVHLLPSLAPSSAFAQSVAIVIDVLRATTTMIHALAAGCTAIIPCEEIDEAKSVAQKMRPAKVLLAGEREGKPIAGFDLGNSPLEFTAKKCRGRTVIMTTTNGTRALIRVMGAKRGLVAGFVNFSAVCEQLTADSSPIQIVCAGSDGEPSFEDTLLAGAFVDVLCDRFELVLNDSARLAWDSFETYGHTLREALELGRGGQALKRLGFDADIEAAADVDKFAFVPEIQRDPARVTVGSVGVLKHHWNR